MRKKPESGPYVNKSQNQECAKKKVKQLLKSLIEAMSEANIHELTEVIHGHRINIQK